MRAHGARRTYAKCRVIRAGFGKKIVVLLHVKNHKADRQQPVEVDND